MTTTAILELDRLTKRFPVRGGFPRRTIGEVHAVQDVDLAIRPGETLGLVGESGCGKSTLARLVVRLTEPTGGSVRFDGRDITHMSRREMAPIRRDLQMIFQDPYSSLNPRKRVGDIVGEPLHTHRAATSRTELSRAVGDLLEEVGLSPDHRRRYPHEFSGGQRQRIGIARAIALRPKLVVCDEPVSALDVSLRAQVTNLLRQLQREHKLTYLFISHDLSSLKYVADRVAVMYLGRVVEIGTRSRIFTAAAHPYTRALMSAVPIPDPEVERRRERIVLAGDVPSPEAPPPGCPFHTRCPRAQEICALEPPLLSLKGDGHLAACHFPHEEPILSGHRDSAMLRNGQP